jgi:hypothetical protein
MHYDLKLAEVMAYIPSEIKIENVVKEKEGKDYGASKLDIFGKKINFRVAKITPKKVGLFVAIWKRDGSVTKPYDIDDNYDLFIISAREGQNFGHLILDKKTLSKYNLISSDKTSGKRGFRIYPPWVNVTNKQAEKSQIWQCEYFVSFNQNEADKYPKLNDIFRP